MAVSNKIADALVKHGIDIQRVDAGLRRKIIAMINGLEQAITKNIRKYDPTELKQITAKTKRLAIMISAISKDTKAVYKAINETIQGDLSQLAIAESTAIVNTVNRALTVELASGRMNLNVAKSLVKGTLVEGAQIKKWWDKADEQLRFDFEREMRQGILNKETIDQMVKRIRGTKANGYKDGIMQGKRHQAQRIVRTSAMTVANEARNATYEQNQDVIKGKQWVSVLDSRTSQICQSLDGSAWNMQNKPIQGTVHPWNGPPPAHWGCRSTIIPILKSWNELSKTKNPEIRRKLKANRPPKSIRASLDGKVSGKMNYEEWLRKKNKNNPSFAKEVLGETKYRLWTNRQLSFSDMIDQSHRPLSVEELLAKVAGKDAQKAVQAKAVAKKTQTRTQAKRNQAAKEAVKDKKPK